MPSLNYHHLLYFWTVAKEGTIARAAEVLALAQPTISGQVKALEGALGEQLFARSGRNLKLTETGELVYHYADEIFSLGQEMVSTLEGRPSGQPRRLRVGISHVLPKTVACRILAPVFGGRPEIQLKCQQDDTDALLSELVTRGYDLVLVDRAITGVSPTKVYNHLLGESGISFFATQDVARICHGAFPALLNGAPLLAQGPGSPLRIALDQWFERSRLEPQIVAEFSDTALIKEFGRQGMGIFAAPTAVEKELVADHRVVVLGRTDEVTERYYAVTAERRVQPPGVELILERARATLFAPERLASVAAL